MRFEFTDGTLLGMHLMLTGDVFLFDTDNERKTTIIEFYFDNGKALALTDRMRNANVKLNPEDKDGIDALDRKLNYNYLKKVLDRKTNIKNILLDQNTIRVLVMAILTRYCGRQGFRHSLLPMQFLMIR